ncbi:hypothetical protein [Bacteroides thetaiotaomicron]|uniref:hypothetical protein n=1 Tax=Bacteroides thetaiotaomicron TaxID=818 RepID=UPI0021663A63|nr:hypothetical protein [Bacteroides thetaiotaomicron]MCS3079012.1 hypothetical protein [Bacteroides thetaiotaomicron]
MNILPKFCRSNATVNYSILNRFKPANIYRFFCLSLSRDDWYNVRITLDELKRTSGGKSVSSFNKKFEEYLDIKPYFVDNGFYYPTRRNIYHIPAMEEQCITISNKFALIKLDAAIKGFFIQLLLLSRCGNVELTKANILKAIKIDEDTYEKYIIELAVVDLLLFGNPLILHTENILLENDFSKQKKLPKKKVNKIVEIDDNGNIIIPK